MSAAPLPLWIELIVAVLLLASGVFTLVATLGLVRLREFFTRMHAPALVATASAWCVTLATVIYFSVFRGELELHSWLIIMLLSITAPVTSILLARAALFRGRLDGNTPLPAALQPAPAHDAAGDCSDPEPIAKQLD